MKFEFATATRIVFGTGKLAELGALARPLGGCALLVTGSRPLNGNKVQALIEAAGLRSQRFTVTSEPSISVVESGIRQAREAGCDLVIAIGGGSVIDAGKAIAAMLANEGALLDYLEVIGHGQSLRQPARSFIAIPTTAGTGTEVTRNAVLGSPDDKVKVSLRSPHMLPTVALIDPELTLDLPPDLTASTGMDALTQLIEPFVCVRANPVTDAICREGLARAARSLPSAFRDGSNASAREDMAIASLFGGLALANAGLGAVHGFAAPIGGMFPAAHGAVCAALLPQVMAANLRAVRRQHEANQLGTIQRYDEIARILTGNHTASAEDGVVWVHELTRELKIPGLSQYGIETSHVAELVVRSKQASSMKANPVALSDRELTAVLMAAL